APQINIILLPHHGAFPARPSASDPERARYRPQMIGHLMTPAAGHGLARGQRVDAVVERYADAVAISPSDRPSHLTDATQMDDQPVAHAKAQLAIRHQAGFGEVSHARIATRRARLVGQYRAEEQTIAFGGAPSFTALRPVLWRCRRIRCDHFERI